MLLQMIKKTLMTRVILQRLSNVLFTLDLLSFSPRFAALSENTYKRVRNQTLRSFDLIIVLAKMQSLKKLRGLK